MGIIRNAANRKIKGRIGDTTYYVSMDRQIARQALNSSNYGESARRSPSQQNRRVMWANLVNFYRASKSWMPKAFESKSAKQTDYNRFMSANLPNARIALTKAMASVSACVADAFIVSQGSLRSIQVSKLTNSWQTDINLGGLEISPETTVGQFSKALIDNNNWILAGDQLSFISYQQYVDAQSTPHIICTAYEVTLNVTSTDVLRNYMPDFCSSTSEAGNLGTNTNISLGGFAYILSRNVGGGALQVSTQQLITNNEVLITQYSSAINVQAAIDSYGVDSDTFLDTGSTSVSRAEQPLYLSYITNGSQRASAGEVFSPSFSDLNSTGLTIALSTEFDSEVSKIKVSQSTGNDSSPYPDITIDGGITHTPGTALINVAGERFGDSYFYPSAYIKRMEITLADGSVITADFKIGSQSAD